LSHVEPSGGLRVEWKKETMLYPARLEEEAEERRKETKKTDPKL
jgi:hypothetical protein